GCGACVVLLSKYDPVLDQVEDFTASSCLTLLCSINGYSITTTEGLGNSKDGFHPIHQRFAGFHASQCGFCTPGMCVSLFAALVNAEKANQSEPSPGFSKLTVSEAEKAISGNLCRCTGYRSIADACKSFAVDVDVEDLGLNSFWRKGESKEVKMSRLPFYNRNKEICTFPEFLKKEIRSSTLLDSKGIYWYNPVSVKELQSFLESNETDDGSLIKLVAGNTGMGYYKELECYDRYIDLRYIPELSSIRRDPKGIEIGAIITISKAIEALKEENKSEFHPKSEMVFKKIANHMEKIASGFIRNTASIGGNLMMAQRKNFPSDIATILVAVGSMVYIMTGPTCERIMLEEFLERPPLSSKTLLLNVKIPSWESIKNISSETDTMLLFETYRAAPRPLGNALPYLNAAFLAEVSPCKTSDGIIVNNCQLAFGAYGTKHAIRARQVEEFLAGKILSLDVLYEATKLVKAIVVPEDGTSSPAYRSSLAIGYLFDFFSPLIDNGGKISNVLLEGYIKNVNAYKINQNHVQLAHDNLPSLLSSGKQVIELSEEYHPVGEPISKSGAAIQASGEAFYVDDIPSPENCLHGTFIYSTKPLAWVKGIQFQPKPLPDGVASIITFKDIPKGGENIGSKSIFGAEPLFAEELTQCAGQRLAFVVADTQKHADKAIKFAVVDYDLENLEPPILSVEEAVKRSSLFEVPPMFYPKEVGDISKGMAEADHKILSAEVKLGSQYYFYMESQAALAIPDEDNCMVVYSSSQVPEWTHAVIARCLGVPEHNVRVITRRVGEHLVESPSKPCLYPVYSSGLKLTFVTAAYMLSVNLSASSFFVPDLTSMQYRTYGAAVEVNILTGETTILQTDIIYDCGQSLNPAVDLGQIEGAFVQGVGFFMLEEYLTNSDGLVVAEGTWTYKIPTLDTIPKQFNVEIQKSGHHQKRVLSSKGMSLRIFVLNANGFYWKTFQMPLTSGEPPLILAASVHCATRAAIKEARKQLLSWSGKDKCSSTFQLEVPATMPVVKEHCGLESVERYLEWRMGRK
ncbi:indole-3-acetaldehyde oxidase, partial [Quercus suber]